MIPPRRRDVAHGLLLLLLPPCVHGHHDSGHRGQSFPAPTSPSRSCWATDRARHTPRASCGRTWADLAQIAPETRRLTGSLPGRRAVKYVAENKIRQRLRSGKETSIGSRRRPPGGAVAPSGDNACNFGYPKTRPKPNLTQDGCKYTRQITLQVGECFLPKFVNASCLGCA